MKIPTSAQIPSYHEQMIPYAMQGTKDIAAKIAGVGGYAIMVANRQVLATAGEIKPGSVFDEAGGAAAISTFATSLERQLRSAIRKGAWIYTAPDKWKSNIAKQVDPASKKPYFSSDVQTQNIATYEKREIEVMPIIILLADPTIPSAKRDAALSAAAGVGSSTYAWYAEGYGAYCFNLISDKGWETIKPTVKVNNTSGPMSENNKQETIGGLINLFSNPQPVEHVARHEYGHGEENLYAYFIQQMLINRSDKGMTASTSKVAVLDPTKPESELSVVRDNLRIARLEVFKRAVSQYSSDLINATTPAQVEAAVLKRQPGFSGIKNLRSDPRYINIVAQYARVLVNLGLITSNSNPLYVIGSDYEKIAQYKQTKTPAAGKSSTYSIGAVVTSDPAALQSRVKAVIFGGGNDYFEQNHLIDTIKMIQQNSDPNNVDVEFAVSSLEADPVASEEARRARVLIDLAGPAGFKKAVEQFAAIAPSSKPAAGAPASGTVGSGNVAGSAVA